MFTDHHHRRTQSESFLELANVQSFSMEFDTRLVTVVTSVGSQAPVIRRGDSQQRDLCEDTSERTNELRGIEDQSVSRIDDQLGIHNARDNAQKLEVSAHGIALEDKPSNSSSSDSALDSESVAIVGSFIVPKQDVDPEARRLRVSMRLEPDIVVSVPALPHYTRYPNKKVEVGDGEIVLSMPQAFPISNYGKNTALRKERKLRGNSSSPSSSNSSKENITLNPRQMVLEKVRRDKIFSRAIAYHEAKNSRYQNRYNREAAQILAFENQKKIKAFVDMEKVEMKLEERRAEAFVKMQNEIALSHKKKEQAKKTDKATRAENKAPKLVEAANRIRMTGKIPIRCLFF